jgi:hypothetical protein
MAERRWGFKKDLKLTGHILMKFSNFEESMFPPNSFQ